MYKSWRGRKPPSKLGRDVRGLDFAAGLLRHKVAALGVLDDLRAWLASADSSSSSCQATEAVSKSAPTSSSTTPAKHPVVPLEFFIGDCSAASQAVPVPCGACETLELKIAFLESKIMGLTEPDVEFAVPDPKPAPFDEKIVLVTAATADAAAGCPLPAVHLNGSKGLTEPCAGPASGSSRFQTVTETGRDLAAGPLPVPPAATAGAEEVGMHGAPDTSATSSRLNTGKGTSSSCFLLSADDAAAGSEISRSYWAQLASSRELSFILSVACPCIQNAWSDAEGSPDGHEDALRRFLTLEFVPTPGHCKLASCSCQPCS